MFNIYTDFLRDYSSRAMCFSKTYMWFLLFMWILLFMTFKWYAFKTVLSRKIYLVLVVLTTIGTLTVVWVERDNIFNMIRPVENDKQLVSILNESLIREYKPSVSGKKYAISFRDYRVKDYNNKTTKEHNYYYKIDTITAKSFKDNMLQFKLHDYASVQNHVSSIGEKEYIELKEKLEEDNIIEAEKERIRKEEETKKLAEQKAKEKADRLATRAKAKADRLRVKEEKSKIAKDGNITTKEEVKSTDVNGAGAKVTGDAKSDVKTESKPKDEDNTSKVLTVVGEVENENKSTDVMDTPNDIVRKPEDDSDEE